MLDLQQSFQRYKKYIFYLMALYILGWGFTDYSSVFLGLFVGTALSLFNLWTIVLKQKQFKRFFDQGRVIRSLGTGTRMATAALAVFIAMKFPNEVHLVSVVIGLMTIYIVIMIDCFTYHIRS